ncbi:hypothetical protein MKZ38_001618 [Zalerion maritima]|uniref:Metallo-beta-lactamase domain-containing protein n=1 Tax=Zalerion maritima TaxID=339359 RepID=A0AAD5WRS7_9PEZI|nr:hypothetical protein MKZ38_001618 [Zalerion maritima]
MSSLNQLLAAASGTADVVLLDGGGFTTADDTKIHADGHHEPFYLYDWCFYIHHKATGRKILWDLGISNDSTLYTPFVLNYHFPSCNPVGPRCPLADQLGKLGVGAEDIDTVIFSHAHWDHCRPLKHDFPNAKIVFGPGTGTHCSPGHIKGGEIQPMVQWDSRFFGAGQVRTDPFEELDGRWEPWGPFDRAMDYFGDGSFWVIQAPGHMAGNLAADIFLGRREIGNVPMPDGSMFCLHEDLGAAVDTIGKLREAVDQYGMHIAMAHDPEFIRSGSDEVLMSILHPLFDGDCLKRIRAGEQP